MKNLLITMVFSFIPTLTLAAPSQMLVDFIDRSTTYDEKIYVDLDGDGKTEAIAIDTHNCSPAGCLFEIVEDDNFGIRIAARQYGKSIRAVSQGRVIDANGVYWIWNGSALTPYASLLESMEPRKPSLEEKQDILSVAPWHEEIPTVDVSVYDIDISGNSRLEKLMILKGTKYLSGNAQPYLIFDQDGMLLDEGASPDLPMVYRYTDTDETVILTPIGKNWSAKIYSR